MIGRPARPGSKRADDIAGALLRFVERSRFATRGGVVIDLDGTAVHEHDGRVVIASAVECGLKAIIERGRPLVLNSLRFPLSVIRTFGREWYRLSGAPVPTVSLNGSLIGHIVADASGTIAFDELDAFPLRSSDIDEMLDGVRHLIDARVDDVLLFYYPRDWTKGEIVWTPLAERVAQVAYKYTSASAVCATDVDTLSDRLHREDICMLTLLADVPEDRRMAYQHTKSGGFVTRIGVDKRSGARAIARHMAIELDDSVGAGDTELDTFLDAVGMAIIVGDADLAFRGAIETVRLPDSLALGETFYALAALIDDRAATAARAVAASRSRARR